MGHWSFWNNQELFVSFKSSFSSLAQLFSFWCIPGVFLLKQLIHHQHFIHLPNKLSALRWVHHISIASWMPGFNSWQYLTPCMFLSTERVLLNSTDVYVMYWFQHFVCILEIQKWLWLLTLWRVPPPPHTHMNTHALCSNGGPSRFSSSDYLIKCESKALLWRDFADVIKVPNQLTLRYGDCLDGPNPKR